MSERNDINTSSGNEAEIQAERERRNEGNVAKEKFLKEHAKPEEEAALKDIDDRFNNLNITAEKRAEQYELQNAQALTALKKYVKFSYKKLGERIRQISDPKERDQWRAEFEKTRGDVATYTGIIQGFLLEFQENHKEGIDLKALQELGQKGNEIFEQMINNKEYGNILHKVVENKLDKPSFDFIYNKIQRRTVAGPLKPEDAIALLDQAGVTSILSTMKGKQRLDFAEHVVDSGKPDALAILTSFVGSGYLSMGQADRLVDRAIAKGLVPQAQKEAVLASMLAAQEKNAEFEQTVGDRLERPQYKSQLHRVMEPKFLGGLFLTAWRGINLLATCMAYRKDFKELLGSPYVYADVAGIFAGTALMGNPTILDFLQKASKGQKNEKEFIKRQAELMALMSRYDGTSKKYFEKGGMVEAINAIRKEHAVTGKTGVATLQEIKEEAKKQYVMSRNPDLAKDLDAMNPEQLRQFTILASKVYETPAIIDTNNYKGYVAKVRQAEGLVS